MATTTTTTAFDNLLATASQVAADVITVWGQQQVTSMPPQPQPGYILPAPTGNNTMLYVGIAAVAVVGVIFLMKKG